MARVYSFTDKNGKRGVTGSYVYPATLDLDPETTDETRRAQARKVKQMFQNGATYLLLEGSESGGEGSYAKNFVIIKEVKKK